jgi:hypothetical protein
MVIADGCSGCATPILPDDGQRLLKLQAPKVRPPGASRSKINLRPFEPVVADLWRLLVGLDHRESEITPLPNFDCSEIETS